MLSEAFGEFWVKPKLGSAKGGWDMTLDEIWATEGLSTTGGRLINIYEVSSVILLVLDFVIKSSYISNLESPKSNYT